MHNSIVVSDNFGLDDLMHLDLSGFLDDTTFLNEGDTQNLQSDGFEKVYPVFDDEIIWHDSGSAASKSSNSTVIGINGEGSATSGKLHDTKGRTTVHKKRSWSDFLPIAMQKLKDSNVETSVIRSSTPKSQKSICRSRMLRQSPPVDLPDLLHSTLSSDLEDSEDSGGDEEYVPTRNLISKKQRGPSPYSSLSTTGRASASLSPCARPRKDKRARGSPPSRNKQATVEQVEDLRRSLRCDKSEKANLACPFPGCVYEQHNGRMPDFRRHIKTHIRKDGEVRCKGVSWDDALSFPQRFRNAIAHEKPYTIPNEPGLWVGGCLKTFSRADALKRHLNTTSCEGYR